MTHNSRKAWKTIIHLSKKPASSAPPCLVNTNQVAHQLLINGRDTVSTKPKRPVLPPTTEVESKFYPFNEKEYRRDIADLNKNRIDDVLVEQLTNLGPRAHKWLLAMLNNCFTLNKIPTTWRKSKIITILKQGPDSAIPKNCRPMTLLFDLESRVQVNC